jgi:hypothetical protein
MGEKLTLKNVEIVFANVVDEGFGKSITINATDKDIKASITKWVEDNKIGKAEKAGVPNFKDYEGKTQYAFKINDYTQFGSTAGLEQKDLGFGAKVSLVAKAFVYDNKFGKGNGAALSAVFIEKRAPTGADADLESLMLDAPTKDVVTVTDEDISEPINLEDIPF